MTPSRRLCSCYILFSACLQLSSLPAVTEDANSRGSCGLPCASLGINPFPFGASAACAVSPRYVLSNCTPSSAEAYWDCFSDAAVGVAGSPAVTALGPPSGNNGDSSEGVVFRLSWNKSLVEMGSCPPLYSYTDFLFNIPSSIHLTPPAADNFSLSFTSDNTILLFDCNSLAEIVSFGIGVAVREGSACVHYKDLCRGLSERSCFQWFMEISSTEEVLDLINALFMVDCSHFMFGIPSVSPSGVPSPAFTNFTPAVFEFQWKNVLVNETHCYGGRLKCSTGWKVLVAVAATVGFLGICVLIRVGYPHFINVAVPVVISILKRILRKLQLISYYRPKRPGFDSGDLEGLTERLTEYAYGSLASATKSFSNVVGEGGFGTVYRGTLTTRASKGHGGGSEEQIAVKVLEAKSKHSKKQFLNEVATIGKIHHVNVVRLLGFCTQEDRNMLVYEYVVNGSLDKWLFSKKENPEECVLDWGQRFAIALGMARGLSYLHEECRHRTVHCDIKPQNILLDAGMRPKIADFGLARLMSLDESKVVTIAKGTPGYIAPEFWRGGESQLSTKFDVYSYGMVLLELISGHRNFDARIMANGSPFPVMAFEEAMEGDLKSIVDPRLDITSEVDEMRSRCSGSK